MLKSPPFSARIVHDLKRDLALDEMRVRIFADVGALFFSQRAKLSRPAEEFAVPDWSDAFVREADGQRVLVVFNLSASAVQWPLPDGIVAEALEGHGLQQATCDGGTLSMPARGVYFASIA